MAVANPSVTLAVRSVPDLSRPVPSAVAQSAAFVLLSLVIGLLLTAIFLVQISFLWR